MPCRLRGVKVPRAAKPLFSKEIPQRKGYFWLRIGNQMMPGYVEASADGFVDIQGIRGFQLGFYKAWLSPHGPKAASVDHVRDTLKTLSFGPRINIPKHGKRNSRTKLQHRR